MSLPSPIGPNPCCYIRFWRPFQHVAMGWQENPNNNRYITEKEIDRIILVQMWIIPGLALQTHMSKPYQTDSLPSVTSIKCCFWKQNLTLSFVFQPSSSGMSPPPPPEYLPKLDKPRKASRSVFPRPPSLVLE